MPENPVAVARGVPLIDDRLLLELANDLHTAEDLTRARAREGFFARLLSRATGRDRVRTTDIDNSGLSAQRRMLDWLTGLTESMTVTNLVVAEVTEDLADLRREVRESAAGRWSPERIDELGAVVGKMARDAGRILSAHERRLAAVEARLAVDAAVRRWRHPRHDHRLPWLPRAVLLAREAAAGPAGEYAHSGGAGREIRNELVERMLQDPPVPWYDGARSLAGMLAEAAERLPSDEHRRMTAELLGVGLPDALADHVGPLTRALAATVGEAADGTGQRLDAVAQRAVSEASGVGDAYLRRSLTVDELLRRVVAEQFAEAGARRARLKEQGPALGPAAGTVVL